ncbi:MAG: 50S ribosomal protein L4 [Verrucomicrobiota bacterium]
MKLTIKDLAGKDVGEFEVKLPVIANGKGTQAVHDTVVAYQAAQRSGNACTKTMGDVAGTGKKPWRQKGTGRARAGSFASPLWRGGGVVFGPKPRDFTKKVNGSTKQLALRKALSERLKSSDVLIVGDLKLTSSKTKDFVAVLKALGVTKSVVLVIEAMDQNLRLASRNVPNVEVVSSDDLNTYQALRPDKIVFTKLAFEKVEERLSK